MAFERLPIINFPAAWGEVIEFPNTRTSQQFTHKIFGRYPARSINLIPRKILREYESNNGIGSVLDPFMGSGTTAVEASLLGFSTYGVEIDQFARLVTEVSVTRFTQADLIELQSSFKRIDSDWPNTQPNPTLYPRLQNLEYWFEEETFSELLKLKTAVYNKCENEKTLAFFKIVFADILRPCSKAERQTLKPYISKKYIKTPAPVGDTFRKSFETYFSAVSEFSLELKGEPLFKWIGNNATSFNSPFPIDIAISSPPYLNSIDYTRCIKIESSWIDCTDDKELRRIKNNQIGDESRTGDLINPECFPIYQHYVESIQGVDPKRALVIRKYFDDMTSNLKAVYECLRDGGTYHLIIGNSVIRGIPIPTHEILAKLGEVVGFSWANYFSYKIKDHRLSIPRKNRGGKIEFEHVITLLKG